MQYYIVVDFQSAKVLSLKKQYDQFSVKKRSDCGGSQMHSGKDRLEKHDLLLDYPVCRSKCRICISLHGVLRITGIILQFAAYGDSTDSCAIVFILGNCDQSINLFCPDSMVYCQIRIFREQLVQF